MISSIFSWFLCTDYPVLLFSFIISLIFEPMFDTFPERIWPFLSGSLEINRLKRDIDLGSRVVIVHPRIKFSKFTANELCSNRKNGTLIWYFFILILRENQLISMVNDHEVHNDTKAISDGKVFRAVPQTQELNHPERDFQFASLWN